MKKMTLLHKISYSSLFIALGVILSRFVSVPALFGLPFLKISFSPSIVMFSSIYLGPFFGLIVGSLVDIIGALLFPTGAFNPLYTIPAALTGLMPGLVYIFIRKIKIEDKFPFVSLISISAFDVFIIFFMIFNNSIKSESGKKEYILEPWMKIGIIILALVLSVLFFVLVYLLKKKFKNRKINNYYNIYIVASSVFITYFIFKIPIGSMIQAILLDWDFLIILLSRMLTGFITSFVHIFLISVALNVSLSVGIKGALINGDEA